MKKALVIILICLVAGYLGFSAFYFQDKPKEGVCEGLEIIVENSENSFININEVEKFIKSHNLDPTGKQFREINTDSIQSKLLTIKTIKEAEVFVTNNNYIRVNLFERKPILRVFNNKGQSYYVDTEGETMPIALKSNAYIPVASGAVSDSIACNELYSFAKFLNGNKFWNAQIEQIVVADNQEITLIPRVGDQIIELGKIGGFEKKLEKLMSFYEKGLNETGWNKYSVITLKFDNQVVCKKR